MAFEKALNSDKEVTSSTNCYIESCMNQFDKKCEEVVIEEANCETSTIQEKLMFDISGHMDSVSIAKLTAFHESKLKETLSRPVKSLLRIADDGTWPFIRKLLAREVKLVGDELSKALSDFQIDAETREKMVVDLKKYANDMVKEETKKESVKVVMHMVNRFETIFNYDADSFPRRWTETEDIRGIIKIARSASLKVLSVMAIIRLDDEVDNIEKILSAALVDSVNVESLYTNIWEQFEPSKTIITPLGCRSVWSEFKDKTSHLITTAISEQEANRSSPWIRTSLKIYFCIAIYFVIYLLLKFILDMLTFIKHNTFYAHL